MDQGALPGGRAGAVLCDARGWGWVCCCSQPVLRLRSTTGWLHLPSWLQIIAAWLCCGLYTWTLIAHRVLKNRSF